VNTTNPSVPPTPTPSLPGGRFDSPRLHQSPLTIDEAPAAAVGETDLMTLPPGDGVLSSTWLNSALDRSPDWPHGAIRAISACQVGVGYGMSGRIHRVVGDTERGGSRSLVVKQETAEAVERELLFRGECAEVMQGSIARCYGGMVDVDAGRGVLLLEDIQAAEQGDVLRGCTEEAALAALGALARLHAWSWKETDDAHPAHLPRWGARPMGADLWLNRLTRASERFPEIVTHTFISRVLDLPEKVAVALDALRCGPASWLQLDAHLDNVRWRSDRTAVLLDWCNAAIGPPIADVVRFLSEGVAAESRPVLLGAYIREIRSIGADAEPSDVKASLQVALLPLLQSAVGWAGREDLPPHGRMADICAKWLQSVCNWARDDDSRSQVGSRPV
jgi:Phosphotransferase enzyme family